MGCTNSKAGSTGCNHCLAVQANPSAMARMMEYEKMAASEMEGLKLAPTGLDLEEWRDGLISVRTMFNLFHSGYCSAYIQNPTYMLVLDFRSLEEWLEERVVTSLHHDRLQYLEKCLSRYNTIILYDRDGASVGNLKSPLWKAYIRMNIVGLDPKVVLGGVNALQRAPYCTLLERPKMIPYATVQPTVHNSLESLASQHSDCESQQPDLEEIGLVEPSRRSVHWMPTMILDREIYLGRADQASDPEVIRSLGITHVLSTSRIRASKFRGLVYILVNKASFSASTMKLTTNFILEALAGGGKVLVHGCDGFDQSAAVVVAALMRHCTATLEDCLWLLHCSRPGVDISPQWLSLLAKLEEELFGRPVTDLDSLWCKE